MNGLSDDDMSREVEQIARQWMQEYVNEDGPPGYIGRRRALPVGSPLAWVDDNRDVCANPAGHYHLERSAAQELRMPPTVNATGCPWCGKPYQQRSA